MMKMESIEPSAKRNSLPNISRKNSLASLRGVDLTRLDNTFNKYATKKTYVTGLFDLSLIVTNFTQLKQTILNNEKLSAKWKALDVILLVFISLSILVQIIVIFLLVLLAMQSKFTEKSHRDKITRINNIVILLTIIITIINIFVNVFINVN